MNRPALLVLVRHGQSERNIIKKRNSFYLDDESRKAVRGIPDHLIALTEEGRQQAIATGRALREQLGSFDFVFHSGYRRTIETTEGLLSAYTDAEASAAFPWLQDYWTTFGPFFARPPGGESLSQVCERVYAFLQRVARTMAGKRMLIVSHAGTIWCMRYVLEGWTYEEADRRFNTEPMPNCAVTTYRLDPGLGRRTALAYGARLAREAG